MTLRWLIFGALGLGVIGCAPAGSHVTPVTGVVYLRAAPGDDPAAPITFIPVEGAKVAFVGADDREASAVTDRLGRFRLRSYAGEDSVGGVAPGKYRVTVKKLKLISRDAASTETDEPSVAARYADPASSGLTAEVIDPAQAGIDNAAPPNHFQFELRPES